jgi:dTDP-4-amino-4,6-dideoxygalactose transaminase
MVSAAPPRIPLHRVRMPGGAAAGVEPVLRSGYVADGEQVRAFEAALGDWLGNPNVVTMGDYSSAIAIALGMYGVGPGDEVAATPDACLGTNMPILWRFARAAWCDVDPETGNLDPADVPARIGERTKALLFAHWGGDVADLDALQRVARERGLALVEDASEALGARHAGLPVGAHGSDVTVFSFGPVRHLSTVEGAALVFREAEDAERARRLKRYGIDQGTFRDGLGEIDPASDIPEPGLNSYLNNVAAAIGLAGLEDLDAVVEAHRANGAALDAALGDVPGITRMRRRPGDESAAWVYTLRAERRDDLLRALRDRGVGCSRLHLRNDAYAAFGTGLAELPGVERFSAERLCLPSGWWVGDEERERIVAAVRAGW